MWGGWTFTRLASALRDAGAVSPRTTEHRSAAAGTSIARDRELRAAGAASPRTTEHRSAAADTSIAKGLELRAAGAASPRTTGHRPAAADTSVARDRDQIFTAAKRGLAIERPLPPEEAARRFVSWMRDQDFGGERAWSRLLEFYAWHCQEEGLVPLGPGLLRSQFAIALANLCPRRQIRIREEGRLVRLTTYTIPAETGDRMRQLRRVV